MGEKLKECLEDHISNLSEQDRKLSLDESVKYIISQLKKEKQLTL